MRFPQDGDKPNAVVAALTGAVRDPLLEAVLKRDSELKFSRYYLFLALYVASPYLLAALLKRVSTSLVPASGALGRTHVVGYMSIVYTHISRDATSVTATHA